MSITRINEFKSASGKADELLAFLRSLVPYISSSDGCISCEVMQGCEELDCFVVIEKWDSIAAHSLSIENFPKEEMQSAMSLFGAPPKGRFYKA
jgi:quinol monooxygenase YgiN